MPAGNLDYTYLGALELDRNLTIPDAGSPAIIRTITRTMGGIIQQKQPDSHPATSGREMTITASFDGAYNGRFTRGQKISLNALRDAGEPVLLRHHEGEWMVLVMEVNLEFTRARGANTPDNQNMYGTVTVMTTE